MPGMRPRSPARPGPRVPNAAGRKRCRWWDRRDGHADSRAAEGCFVIDDAQLAAVAFVARYSGRTLYAYRHDLRAFDSHASTAESRRSHHRRSHLQHAAHGAAELRFACRHAGHPLHDRSHANDLWVAASAIQIGAPLLTGDNVFRRRPLGRSSKQVSPSGRDVAPDATHCMCVPPRRMGKWGGA